MLSYNSNYGESGEFVQYGPSKVGLTDCGLQCKVACGCNNSDYWYLTKPHSTHKAKGLDGKETTVNSKYTSVTSEYEYDYIIGDDGNLASTGTTLSSAGKTLSGSSKTLSASSGEKVTCYKQVCSEGFTATKPSDTYFVYDTETLDDGSKCYKVTGCKCGYADKTIASGTDGDLSHNNIPCYKVLCSDENSNWYSSTGGYSHYDNVSSQSSYCNTCYANRHNPDWYCTDTTYSYETSASAEPHPSSAQKEQKCSTCGATRTGTCYAKGSHSYYCSATSGSSYPYDSSSSASPHYATSTTATKTCSKCSSSPATTTGTCYADKSHNYPTPEGYSSSCSSGYYTTATKDVNCNVTTPKCTSKKTFYKCAACPTKVTVGSCEVGTTTFKDDECNSNVEYYTAKRDKYHSEACSGYYTSGDQPGMDCTKLSTQKCGYNCYTCTESNYVVSVAGSFGGGCPSGISIDGLSGVSCTAGGKAFTDTAATGDNNYENGNTKSGSTVNCSFNEQTTYGNYTLTFEGLTGYPSGWSYTGIDSNSDFSNEATVSGTVSGNVYMTASYSCTEKPETYTIHIHKSFGAECPSNFSSGFNGINGGCRIGGQNCSTSSNMYTADNVAKGSTFSVTETGCYSDNSGMRAQLSSCSGNGCSVTAGGGNSYYLSATINREEDITFTYTCQTGTCGVDAPTEKTCGSAGYFGGYSCSQILSNSTNPAYSSSGGACEPAYQAMATYYGLGDKSTLCPDCTEGGTAADRCYGECLKEKDVGSWRSCCEQCSGPT